ncbi:hypothetical protein GCM10012319_00080 [Comamonas sp. KCTC 72670]|nr:hypothetical protein GCM10012319_00080 [Comamonas sp. KCTC 72670]
MGSSSAAYWPAASEPQVPTMRASMSCHALSSGTGAAPGFFVWEVGLRGEDFFPFAEEAPGGSDF